MNVGGRLACRARFRVLAGIAVMLVVIVAGGIIATPPSVASPRRQASFDGPPNPRDLDLDDLVPAGGRIDAVWYVPGGRTHPQVAVSWHLRSRQAVAGWPDQRRYVLTLWNAERVTPGSAHWVPHNLIRRSPYPLVSRAVRLADVTGDGHDDLLVTVECSECNHAVAAASIYATFGRNVRRIYGAGTLYAGKESSPDAVVRGRVITETAWGAEHGIVWFDEPRGGAAVCCPAYRLQTFMRWGPHGWRIVARRKVDPAADRLVDGGYPAP